MQLSNLALRSVLAAVVFAGACTEISAPDSPRVPVSKAPPTSPDLTALSAWILDATDSATPSIADQSRRSELEKSIQDLSRFLTESDANQSVRVIAKIRYILSSASADEYIGLGAIEVALCTIESAMEIGR